MVRVKRGADGLCTLQAAGGLAAFGVVLVTLHGSMREPRPTGDTEPPQGKGDASHPSGHQ